MPSNVATRPDGRPRIRAALRLALIGFAVAVLVFALNGTMFVAAHRLDPARELVEHTRRVQDARKNVLLGLLDAESMQRAYMLTGNPDYLASYERARVATVVSLVRLQALTVDNPRQQAYAVELARLLGRKFDFMDSLTAERAKGPKARYDLARGHALLVRARDLLGRMDVEEARLGALRDDALGRWIRLIQYGILAVLVQQVTLFATGLAAFVKSYRSTA